MMMKPKSNCSIKTGFPISKGVLIRASEGEGGFGVGTFGSSAKMQIFFLFKSHKKDREFIIFSMCCGWAIREQ